MENGNIKLVSTADNKYTPYLGVMLYSLILNKNPDTTITFNIIDGGISTKDKTALLKMAKGTNLSIQFLKIDKDFYKDLRIDGHISQATYYRISIPDLVDDKIKKILYIDCDTIIMRDLSDLWNIDISNHYLAAVREWGLTKNEPRPDSYFNAGVLLLNLEKLRKDNIMSKVKLYIEKNRPTMWDQDGLNAIIRDNYLSLSPKFNTVPCLFDKKSEKWDYIYKYEGCPITDPYIVHYYGPDKFGLLSSNPYKVTYYRYLLNTAWKQSIFRQIFCIPKQTRQNLSLSYLKYYIFNKHKTLYKILKKIKNIMY